MKTYDTPVNSVYSKFILQHCQNCCIKQKCPPGSCGMIECMSAKLKFKDRKTVGMNDRYDPGKQFFI